MVFTSFKFILFFGIVILFYYCFMKKWQWQCLLVASIIFYMSASPVYVLFLLFTMLVTYTAGINIYRRNNKTAEYIKENRQILDKEQRKEYKKKAESSNKKVLILAIVLSLGMLVLLKYTMFIISNIEILAKLVNSDFSTPEWQFILPIGLSFYTFMTIGYCVDVYRGMYPAQRNVAKYALFVSYFPQILQGPIGGYGKLGEQLYERHEFDYERAVKGITRATWGFLKKMVIADNIAILINPVFSNSNDYYGISIVFALVMYAIQIYADFSGFMDIALGCSQVLGIELTENFETPYFSKNIPEFWRRWHISLGSWFRDYVFYPVLRSTRCDRIRKKYKEKGKNDKSANVTTAYALAVVWLTTGIWHGADWSYILWGVYYGVVIILSTVFSKKTSKSDNKSNRIIDVIRVFRTFLIVVAGYSIFRPESISTTVCLWKNMLSGIGTDSLKYLLMGKKIVFITALMFTLLLFIRDMASIRVNIEEWIRKRNGLVRWCIYIGMILIILIFKAGQTQAFSYFKF